MASNIRNGLVVDAEGKKTTKPGKLWLSDGTTDAYTGICLFFLRCNVSRAVTLANIHQVKLSPYCFVVLSDHVL